MILARAGSSGKACGKAILIGEHAAVAGFQAIALPLQSYFLTVEFCDPLALGEQLQAKGDGWTQAWSLFMGETHVSLPMEERKRLTESLQLGLKLLLPQDVSRADLSFYLPQRIEIRSQLPLGAGMGGSAALSAALLGALSNALGLEKSAAEIAALANELDGVFHGRASGLDTNTVVARGIISFQRDRGVQPVQNKRGFWLLLVDTRERTPTRVMVQKVAELNATSPQLVHDHFERIGALSEDVRQDLQSGNLLSLGEHLNRAHESLQALGVSTAKLDECTRALRAGGALGAKLTGGGGGGLALGIFAAQPSVPFSAAWRDAPHYLTFVPADENS